MEKQRLRCYAEGRLQGRTHLLGVAVSGDRAYLCRSGVEGRAVEGSVRVTRTCVIGADELEWRVTTSGGPGGQHANRSLTAVEVRFDIAQSRSLGPRQRARLLERLGPVARASASETRSQTRNRELALERLCARLAAALHVDRPRRPTAPSRGARVQRLEEKRRRGESKQRRRRPTTED